MARSAVWVMRKRGANHAQSCGNLRGAAMEPQAGPSARFADHFDLQPVHPVADAGSQRLGSGLLGRKAGRKALGGVALAQAIGLLRRGVHAIEKARAVAIHRLLDAPDLHQIDSGADDHLVYQSYIISHARLRGILTLAIQLGRAVSPVRNQCLQLPAHGIAETPAGGVFQRRSAPFDSGTAVMLSCSGSDKTGVRLTMGRTRTQASDCAFPGRCR